MRRALLVAVVAMFVVAALPATAEEWPPPGQERWVIYFTGSCNGSKTYNGTLT